jgi:RNA polymerase sigma-70 factor (family 1)
LSDLTTIAALRLGDRFVFEEVFHTYHQKVYFYMLQKTHSAYLAEEVVQLTFIKLWRYRQNLDETLPLSSQVFRIAKTSLIDLWRKERHRTGAVEEVSTDNPVDRLEEKELNERVHRAVNQMPSVRQQVFAMSRFKGMSYKEIARELSISVRTVENHIAQALKQLRHYIPFL